MADYQQVLAAARTLSRDEQARLVRELAGLSSAPLAQLGSAPPRAPAPQSVAWLKSERGHAVLATDTGPADADIPEGAAAIAGMWAGEKGAQS
ncbi:MAG: hypothetical protein K0Q72_2580 [Armatimonadetes bacterium]|jgi:hypothetical protein|nr:hypothetical protein [Armatimonadota bacterium]